MSLPDAIQSVVDELQTKLNVLEAQHPEQFDADPKRGMVLKNLRRKNLKSLISDATALQIKIAGIFS
jgi:hypothetical protein